MRFTRARVLVASGALAVAGTLTGTAITAAAASASSSQVVLLNYCSGRSQVRPTTFDLPGCMSNEFLTALKWASWRSIGYGSGLFEVNNCTPNCAEGKYVKYPILTVLWRAEPRPKHAGQVYFSRLTVIFTGKVPRGPAAQTFVLPSSVP